MNEFEIEISLHRSCETRIMEMELHMCGYDGLSLSDCVEKIGRQMGKNCDHTYSCAITNSHNWVQWRSWVVQSSKYGLALNCAITQNNKSRPGSQKQNTYKHIHIM